MMRKLSISTVFLLAVLGHSFAQNPKVDSLLSLLKTSQEDTLKVNHLIALSIELNKSDAVRAMDYAQQAKTLAESLNYPSGLAYALNSIGLVYKSQSNFLEALIVWENSLKIFKEIPDSVGISNLLSNIGTIYYFKEDFPRALDLHLQSLQISEKLGNKYRMATSFINIGAIYDTNPITHKKALEYYLKALRLCEELNYIVGINTSLFNIGDIYLKNREYDSSLYYFNKVLKENNQLSPQLTSATLNGIGNTYFQMGDYNNALRFYQDSFEKAKSFGAKSEMASSLLRIADTRQKHGDFHIALQQYQEAISLIKSIGTVNEDLKHAYEGLATTYTKIHDLKNANGYYQLLAVTQDTLLVREKANLKKLPALQFNYDLQKKQNEIDLLTKSKEVYQLQIEQNKLIQAAILSVLALVIVIAGILYRNNRLRVKTNLLLTFQNEEISQQKEEIALQRDNLNKQNAEIQKLLLNILPAEVAAELQKNGFARPRYYDNVTVLFTDFKNFSTIAENVSAQDLVTELNTHFIAFDEIIDKYGLEKIKTIGDSYMCASGIPVPNELHALNTVKAGLEIQAYIARFKQENGLHNGFTWDLRIGIHTGPLVAGVVGKKKFAYDIWGNTVNIASRMESNGEPGKVNISASTYEFIKNKYECFHRGKITAKNIGEVDMYFIEKETSS